MSVEDAYQQLRSEMVDYRNQLPNKLYEILKLRSEVMRKFSSKIANLIGEIPWNIVDVAGNPILLPGVNARPPIYRRIKYTGTLGTMYPPTYYAPENGIQAILPNPILYDVQQFINSIKNITHMATINHIYGISSLDAPYNADFENATKKIYVTKNIEERWDDPNSEYLFPPPPYRNDWILYSKVKKDNDEYLVYLDKFYAGSIITKYRLSDSNVIIFYGIGNFRLKVYGTDETFINVYKGRAIGIIHDDYVKLYYKGKLLNKYESMIVYESSQGVYISPAVLVPQSMPRDEVESRLGVIMKREMILIKLWKISEIFVPSWTPLLPVIR